jgi:glycine cleavage system aminomethyltransferase T
MLRNSPTGRYVFPVPAEHTNWLDEQEAWSKTATLFDQSFHMWDVYFKGPDLRRLLSDVTANKLANFGKNRAKQLLAVNEDGYFIGDAILFGLEDDEASAVGTEYAMNWMAYHIEKGGYDVEITRDDPLFVSKTGRRLTFRYQIQGPLALQIAERASGETMPSIKFFQIGEFSIAGVPVRALNHTMTGVPGVENTGLEIWGPAEHSDEVRAALVEAGAGFGMLLGGAIAYGTVAVESGWIPLPVPAVYTGEQMRPYREWLGAGSLEAHGSLAGSYVRGSIEGYYLTPFELGYERMLDLGRDFIGADALRRKAGEPHRRKVWLQWNDEDVTKALGSSLFGDAPTKYMNIPNPTYGTHQYDSVLLGDREVGISTWAAYTRNVGSFSSIAMVDDADARDGAEVTVVWGEPDGGTNRPVVERHRQTPIRATLSTTPLV